MALPAVSGTGGHRAGGDPKAPNVVVAAASIHHLALPDDGSVCDASVSAAGPARLRYRVWKTMPFVIGNETFEKLGSIGTAANLMMYLTSVFHMTNVDAAMALNAFSGTTSLATVFGAFASDLYLGRYSTVGIGCIATLIGMIILTLTAAVPTMHPPPCADGDVQCAGVTSRQLAVLVLAFVFIVAGAGGIRPCNLAFGADQFDPRTESGRLGINSFFNWYYFTFTIAVCVSSTVIIYVQSNVSWWVGFAIPAALMLVSCVLFFAGALLYVRVCPEGSPLAGVVRVAVAAFRNRSVAAPDDPGRSLFRTRHASELVSRLPYTDQFKFLDKAAVVVRKSEVNLDGLPVNPWRLCSMQQVEETKCILRILPVWGTCIVYYVAFAQINTYVVLQATQSDRRVGSGGGFDVPPGSFTIFPMLALTVWIPVYDRLVVLRARRVTGREEGITLLQRMGIGMVLSAVAMLISGIVEQRRRALAVLHAAASSGSMSRSKVSPQSAFWLVLQLAALGLSEAFSQVSQMEFYYKQFPENMHSVAGSLLFSGLALSRYISVLLVSVVHRTTGGEDGWLAEDLNRGKLDRFYFVIGAIGMANFVLFLACANYWYRYKDVSDDDDGHEQDADGNQREKTQTRTRSC